MWNLIQGNPLCYKKKLAQEQLTHLNNIRACKPLVDSSKPWSPGHSLTKFTNKYTINTENDIAAKNNILLSKMMEIQQRNQKNKLSTLYSTMDTTRKRQRTVIMKENEQIMKRLQSANSNYSRKNWMNEIIKNEKYRENLQRRTKTNDDFNTLAHQEQLKRCQTSQSLRRRNNQYQNRYQNQLGIQNTYLRDPLMT